MSWADMAALGHTARTQRQILRIAQVLYPLRTTLHSYHGREGHGLAWHGAGTVRTVWVSTARLSAEIASQHGEIIGLATLASRLRELGGHGVVHKGKIPGSLAAYWRAWPWAPLYYESPLTRHMSPRTYTLARA